MEYYKIYDTIRKETHFLEITDDQYSRSAEFIGNNTLINDVFENPRYIVSNFICSDKNKKDIYSGDVVKYYDEKTKIKELKIGRVYINEYKKIIFVNYKERQVVEPYEKIELFISEKSINKYKEFFSKFFVPLFFLAFFLSIFIYYRTRYIQTETYFREIISSSNRETVYKKAMSELKEDQRDILNDKLTKQLKEEMEQERMLKLLN